MYVVTPVVAIEITRRCNLTCAHCMRGDAENINISRDLLEKFFDEVKSANVLVISGGEPFLCYDQIKMLLEVIALKRVRIPNVAIVTNGAIYDERIYELLEKCFEDIFINISIDDYHVDSIENTYRFVVPSYEPRLMPATVDEVMDNIDLHKSRGYFKWIYTAPKYLIDSGRARNLDRPKKPFRPMGYFYSECMKEYLVAGPRIYLDCLGYIAEGDSEYASREALSIGNLHDSMLTQMLFSNAIKIDSPSGEDFALFLRNRENDHEAGKEKSYIYKDNKLVEVGGEQARIRQK